MHFIAFYCISLHCIALYFIVFYWFALQFIALHCILLHCIIFIELYCIVTGNSTIKNKVSARFKNGFIEVNFETVICGVLWMYNLKFFASSGCVQWMHTIFFNSLEHVPLTPLMADGLHASQISKYSTSTYITPSFRINLCGLDVSFLTCLLSDQEQLLKADDHLFICHTYSCNKSLHWPWHCSLQSHEFLWIWALECLTGTSVPYKRRQHE